MATETQDKHSDDTIPFFPDHALTELWVAIGVLGIVFITGIIGQLNPVGLEPPADPFNTPLHIKPEWYFLFLYQMLKYVPKTVGVLIPIIGIMLIMIWPFLERKTEHEQRARLLRIIAIVAFLLAATILTILGEVS